MARTACLVKGSINVDEYFEVAKIVKPGETVSSTSYTKRPGGKGANGAVAIAKAGGAAAFAGLIGNDAQWLREALDGHGVRVGQLATSNDLPTGRAFIQVEKRTGENSIVLFNGANHPPCLELPDLSRYTHLLVQNEIPFEHTSRTLLSAQERGLVTICNPSPVPDNLHRFEHVDWLIVNEGEAGQIAPEWDGHDAMKVAKLLLVDFNHASTGVVVTLGAQGAVVALGVKGDPDSTFADDSHVRRCRPFKISGEPVDTTGAGDCFTGFFVAALMRLPKLPPFEQVVEAVEVSCCAASLSVEKEGTMESYPTEDQVRNRWTDSGRPWPAWA